MGPIIMYNQADVGDKDSKLKWVDNCEGNKDILRTNPSEDDLCLKEFVDPIICHRTDRMI